MKKKNKGKKQSRSHPVSGEPYKFLQRLPSWLILPHDKTNPFQRIALDKVFPTLKESLQAYQAFQIQYPKDSFQFKMAQNVYSSKETYDAILCSIRKAASLNRTLRFQFKRFLNIYRFRKFQLVNTEDIVTLEPIEKPIRIYNWSQKKIYTFEARPLLNDSVNRLLYNEEFFLNPKEPRNLLTNEPFTYSQLISIHRQLLSYGFTHWIWECFAKSAFSKDEFVRNHQMPIQLFLLDTLIKKGIEPSIHDIVVDFILAEYEYHNYDLAPPESMLYILLKAHWNHPFMKRWISECHLTWDLRIRKVEDLKKRLQRIRQRTQELVGETVTLIHLYNSSR